MKKLTQKNLKALSDDVAVPQYDRSKLTPGIIHIGVGNFHRSHQAKYIHDALNAGESLSWGILGAGIMSGDATLRENLKKQDWLSSVLVVDQNLQRISVVGSMIDFLPVQPDDNAALIKAMSLPEIKIVSLTITEGGYFLKSDSNEFDLTHKDIVHDIHKLGRPRTVFGAILAALWKRWAHKLPGFTLLSCDNIPGNGDVARSAILSMASSIDTEFSKWVETSVSFPNSMVDRITPRATHKDQIYIYQQYNFEDSCAVICEPYRQWVLEDKFICGRPALERVGATFTDNIHKYEELKIRILNGGHSILAYPAALIGAPYIHEAMQDPLLKAFMRKVIIDDVLPYRTGVDEYSPRAYLDLICERFENPNIADTVERVCFDGSNKFPKFLVPSMTENVTASCVPQGLILTSALWCRYCAGKTDEGRDIAPNDPIWPALQHAAQRALKDPKAWLAQKAIYGNLGQDEGFSKAFETCLKRLDRFGTAYTIERYLQA